MKIKKNNYFIKLILLLLYWVVLQDFVLALLYKITGSAFFVKILFYSKDVLFVALILYTIFKNKIPTVLFVSFIGLFICIGISSIIAIFKLDISFMSLIQNIRNIILLIGFVIIGYGIKDKQYFEKAIQKKYFPFLVFCAAVGIIEYYLDIFIGTKSFWTDVVGITEFYCDIKGQANRMVMGFPGNFYGDYGTGYFSAKRMVGFWMGPLTSAYALLIPLTYYFLKVLIYKNTKVKTVLSLGLLAYALYLTHTRAIIITFMAIALLIFFIFLKQHLKKDTLIIIILIAIVAFIAVLIIKADYFYSVLYDGSTIGHIESVQQALISIGFNLFGSGIGYLGINGGIGTESAYLTILGNLGIVGFIFYILPFVVCMWRLLKNRNKNLLLLTVFYTGLCYAVTGLISEQLFAYTSIAPFYVLLGFAVHQSPKKVKQCYPKLISVETDKMLSINETGYKL